MTFFCRFLPALPTLSHYACNKPCDDIIAFTNLVLSLRFCGGLILDVKRKLPFFASDFCDALHIQSLSAILFIYLGTVTNAITFGGLLGDATDNMQVNVIERVKTYRHCI